jgi:hypothetical protein
MGKIGPHPIAFLRFPFANYTPDLDVLGPTISNSQQNLKS